MYKLIVTLITLVIFFINSQPVSARANSFVSVVNPVRGGDFWENKNQSPQTALNGQIKILNQSNIKPTWLLRYDALNNQEIVSSMKSFPSHEKGLFLEVTPTWTQNSDVSYNQSDSWHFAGSAFLTGYEREEREKLIDESFEKFKQIFGEYPTSVGAWWIDGYSLEYMQKKYGITASLIVADQYTTDNYQIWGQFWSTPYYPSKRNALEPARNEQDKLSLVMMQWAARDPVNAYGNGVGESTYSVQANDYLNYHNLTTDYFSKLLDIYTTQKFNKFGHVVVGLENSYEWEKYGEEYKRQIKTLVEKRNRGQFSIIPMKDFAKWYMESFPQYSPEHVIAATDPLGSEKQAIWFMNLNYRVGWFFNQDGSVIRDIHQYTGGEEICYIKRCDEVNFATSATRVLDEVSFGHKWIIDEGKIKDYKIQKQGDRLTLTYINEAGNKRQIDFLPKDIGIDGVTSSIDGVILTQTEHSLSQEKVPVKFEEGSFKWSLRDIIFNIAKFILFLIVLIITPGLILINKIFKDGGNLQKLFLSIVSGIVLLTLLVYILSLTGLRDLIYVYGFINFIIVITVIIIVKPWGQIFQGLILNPKHKSNLAICSLVLAGTIFQIIPTFKSTLHFPYGLGFWGPNTHDGVWHISLINQLIRDVPPQNPILASEILKNYHYFYDLLIAATSYLTEIPVADLVFRFYPIIFSLSLGVGTYYLIRTLFIKRLGQAQTRLATFFGLYLVYFAGSFGWIVDLIKGKGMGGESNFWANQSISFNLNPPFAISLLIIIAILQILFKMDKLNKWGLINLTILVGSLIAFKAYGGVLILGSLLLVGIIKRSINHLIIFLTSLLVSAFLFLSNFSTGGKLIIFSPFWFVHSMIDSPDRVGWVRLTLAREAGYSQGNWFKFFAAESISLFLFIVGNLGTRVFALFSLFKLKMIFEDKNYLFLFIFSLAALAIPILFIQAGNPWNTIQFIYYFLYISAIVSGVFLSKFLSKGFLLGLPFILFIGIITPINSWATANGYLTYRPHALITNKEFDALQFLSQQEDGVVLTYPYDKRLKQKMAEPWPLFVYDSTAYVSAFSKKATFIEDEPQNQILLTDYKKRLVASKDFFARLGIGEEAFLKENKIKYIYIPKIFKIKLDENIGIKNIFENEEVIIYEIEKK